MRKLKIYGDGSRFWWLINNKRHRENGPAVEWDDGDKHWYLNGVKYTEEKYNEKIGNKK